MLDDLTRIRPRTTGRSSSWNTTGRNQDHWRLAAGETAVLADIKGPARITHLWMTQRAHYRDCLLRITYDNAETPSVLVPLGDFFGLGHGMVSSYQSMLFTASTDPSHHGNRRHDIFHQGCALNCYAPMPFRERCVVELVNESGEEHRQFFYIDHETLEEVPPEMGYFHAEFRRANPFGGWGPEIRVNTPEANIVNTEKLAWENNYLILETRGRGHYVGCNLSVTNFQGTWWGEGDDMIWVDGYKWPPDLHGTGSEDYLNQAWCMQPNAYLRNGSSIYEQHTGGYQTSYVLHLENPVRFEREIKVTIEHGHANHLANEVSSTAYWYAAAPTPVVQPPEVAQRQPVLRDNRGRWLDDPANRCPGAPIALNEEMKRMKARWADERGE